MATTLKILDAADSAKAESIATRELAVKEEIEALTPLLSKMPAGGEGAFQLNQARFAVLHTLRAQLQQETDRLLIACAAKYKFTLRHDHKILPHKSGMRCIAWEPAV